MVGHSAASVATLVCRVPNQVKIHELTQVNLIDQKRDGLKKNAFVARVFSAGVGDNAG